MSKFINRTAKMAERQEQVEIAEFGGLDAVTRIIVVAGGKGGVGTSTVAVNLAAAFAAQGKKTGLLDADVYSPDLPLMLDLHEPVQRRGGYLLPAEKYGLKVMSIGLLGEGDTTLARQGSPAGKAIRQLLYRVEWGELDYLFIDLPPGIGVPAMTDLPACHVLMVTTPQQVALAGVKRCLGLFRTAGLQIIGLVENLSYFMCGHSIEPVEMFGLFGAGGGQQLSEETGLPLLANIPVEMEIGRAGDAGVPLPISAPATGPAEVFFRLARRVAAAAEETPL